jgi:hypothetical protein
LRQPSFITPVNVNYAVKSSLLLSFLESVPEVSAKLKEPNTKGEPFEDVVQSAQSAAVLMLAYTNQLRMVFIKALALDLKRNSELKSKDL